MPHHRLTFRTRPADVRHVRLQGPNRCPVCHGALPPRTGVSQRAEWMTRNVAKWFCSGRSVRKGELEGPEYGPKRRSLGLGG